MIFTCRNTNVSKSPRFFPPKFFVATAQFEYCSCAFLDKLGFKVDLATYLLYFCFPTTELAAGFYTVTVNRGMGYIGG